MDAAQKYYHILFGVRRSVRYHQRRRSYFEFLHNCITLWHIMAGSSAMVFFFGQLGHWGGGLAATSALLAAGSLALGIPRRMTWHATLSQKFSQLEHEMAPYEDADIDQAIVPRFQQRRLEIEAEEPPKLRTIDLLCHNELVKSTYTHGDVYPIGWWKRLLGHIFDLEVDAILDKPSKNQPRHIPSPSVAPDTAIPS